MSLKRHAAKRDASEPAIVQAVRQVGAKVLYLDKFDLLIGIVRMRTSARRHA